MPAVPPPAWKLGFDKPCRSVNRACHTGGDRAKCTLELAVELRRANRDSLDSVQKFPQVHFIASAVGRWFEWRSRLAHAAQLGLPAFGGVDPLDVAESAAAVRSATNLRSISRISGSVVRSAASAHFLAWRRYSAASELMERLVSMSIVGTSHMWGVAASLSPTLCLGSATLCQIGTLLVTFGEQCCISATAATDLRGAV